jgi:hypothetical protein
MGSVFWDIDDAIYCRWVVGHPATRLILSPVVYDDLVRSLSASEDAAPQPVSVLKSRYGDVTVETNNALLSGSWTIV